MSDEKKKSDEAAGAAFDPLKMFSEMYDGALRQASRQWDETARSPAFLAALANGAEQTMQFQRQMQEAVATALAALNLPTRDDLLLLAERVGRLEAALARVEEKIDRRAKKSAAAAPRAKAKRAPQKGRGEAA